MTFDQHIGMQYLEVEGGSGAYVDVEAHHCNPTGNIDGALMISIADNISTGAANKAYAEKYGEDKFMVGIDLHATMLSNQMGGRIRGEARPVRVGRRVTVVRTQIVGDDERLLAEVTTTHVPT